MVKKTFFLLLVLTLSLFASPPLEYKNSNKTFFEELLTKKTTYLSENIVINFDLMSAYMIVSEDYERNGFINTLYNKNPDKVLCTFSYKF